MPFIPVANTALVEVRYVWDSQRVENTLYFEHTVGWSATTMEALGFDVRDWWLANLQARQSNTVLLSEIAVTDLTSATAPSITIPGGGTFSGARVSPSLPNSVTAAISLRTAGRGRSNRGRNYLVGLTEDQVAQNTLDSGEATLYTDAYNALPAVALANSSTWVIVSRFTNGAPRTAGVTEPVTLALFADRTIDSQRRRLPGRGA